MDINKLVRLIEGREDLDEYRKVLEGEIAMANRRVSDRKLSLEVYHQSDSAIESVDMKE